MCTGRVTHHHDLVARAIRRKVVQTITRCSRAALSHGSVGHAGGVRGLVGRSALRSLL